MVKTDLKVTFLAQFTRHFEKDLLHGFIQTFYKGENPLIHA